MKMKLAIFKKGKPVYWIVGAVVLFVIFYLITSKGAGQAANSGGGVAVINQGPSDAQIQAGAAFSMAQVQANTAANIAGLEAAVKRDEFNMNVALANIGANIAGREIDTSATLGLASYDLQRHISELNAEYSLETAKIVSSEAITMRQIDRAAFGDQLAANNDSLRIQSANMTNQALISQVGSLKKKDRDETLQILSGAMLNNPVNYTNPRGPAIIYGPYNNAGTAQITA